MRTHSWHTLRRGVFLLSLLWFSSPFVQAQRTDESGRQLVEARYTRVPPTIDGIVKADEWSGAQSTTVDFATLGIAGNSGPKTSDGPEDLSYTFRVLYDDAYLYIGVTVKDDVYVSSNYGRRLQWDLPVTWENDSVEVFFDGDSSRSEGSSRNPLESETGGQWIYGIESNDSPLPFVSPVLYGKKERPYGPGAGDVWYARTTVDKNTADWQQEARFKLSILGSPSANSQIGFNIAVDDIDREDADSLTPGHYAEVRDMQLYWTVFGYNTGDISAENTHELEKQWGTMKFIKASGGGAFSSVVLKPDGTVTITWTGGRVQSASNVGGPYSDLTATSPLTVKPEGTRFYRIAP